jgi:hypothetical protein
MTNHNTPQLSRMDLANHCAAFPGLSRLDTRALLLFVNEGYTGVLQLHNEMQDGVVYTVAYL